MTRRRFLQASQAAVLIGPLVGGAAAGPAPGEAPPELAPDRPGGQRSVVVRVQSGDVAFGKRIRENILSDMFASAIRSLAEADSLTKAWQTFLRPEDVVGLKFDLLGSGDLGTGEPLARLLVSSLVQAGWSPDHIVIAGDPGQIAETFGTAPLRYGWSSEIVEIGGRRDQVCGFADQVSAIVNVPFLKNDNIFQISAGLKGITYDMVRHAARYHARSGVWLGEIAALPQIRGKLRLNVVNALRVVFDGGPLVQPEAVDDTGLLLLSTDPVAVDTIGLDVLNTLRQQRGLPAIAPEASAVPSLLAAARRGVGNIDLRLVERRVAPPS